MKPSGIVRAIDDLGRIVLPAEYRKQHAIVAGTHIEMSFDGDAVIIRPCRLQCVFCGDKDEETHVIYNGVRVCPRCQKGVAGARMKEVAKREAK